VSAMRRERRDLREGETADEREPSSTSQHAIAIAPHQGHLGAAELRRLSHSAGNQSVVRMLQGSRLVQREINRGDRFSTTAATQILAPQNSTEPLLAGTTNAINGTFSADTRQWIQAFCGSNGKGNRFSEVFDVTFAKGKTKVKNDSKDMVEGAASLAIEVDFRGAAHGGVPTPHFKVYSKYGAAKNWELPWSVVWGLSEAQVTTILTANSLASLKANWTREIQKHYTHKNFGATYTPL